MVGDEPDRDILEGAHASPLDRLICEQLTLELRSRRWRRARVGHLSEQTHLFKPAMHQLETRAQLLYRHAAAALLELEKHLDRPVERIRCEELTNAVGRAEVCWHESRSHDPWVSS